MSVEKKLKYDVQGGIRNYLGKQKTISNVPLKWKSGPGHPKTELAYITKEEKDLLIKKDLHNSLKNGPNKGPGGIMSLNNDGIGDTGGPGSGGSENAGTDDGGNSMGGGTGPSVQAPPGVNTNPVGLADDDAAKGTLSDPLEKFDFVGNTAFGPTQTYTGGSSFFGGANKYGYSDVDTNPFSNNYGEAKPGYGGRVIGGLLGLATGIPFIGGAIGNTYDKGKGFFSTQPQDMSKYNNLGLYTERPQFTGKYGTPTLQGDYDIYGNKINELTGEILDPVTGEVIDIIPDYPEDPDGGITNIPIEDDRSDQYVDLIDQYVPDDPTIPNNAFNFESRFLQNRTKEEREAIEKDIQERFKDFGLGDMDGS